MSSLYRETIPASLRRELEDSADRALRSADERLRLISLHLYSKTGTSIEGPCGMVVIEARLAGRRYFGEFRFPIEKVSEARDPIQMFRQFVEAATDRAIAEAEASKSLKGEE